MYASGFMISAEILCLWSMEHELAVTGFYFFRQAAEFPLSFLTAILFISRRNGLWFHQMNNKLIKTGCQCGHRTCVRHCTVMQETILRSFSFCQHEYCMWIFLRSIIRGGLAGWGGCGSCGHKIREHKNRGMRGRVGEWGKLNGCNSTSPSCFIL